jgi:hypothetical protein
LKAVVRRYERASFALCKRDVKRVIDRMVERERDFTSTRGEQRKRDKCPDLLWKSRR